MVQRYRVPLLAVGSTVLILGLVLSGAGAQSFTNPGFDEPAPDGSFQGWNTNIVAPPGQTGAIASVTPFEVLSGVSSPAATFTTIQGLVNNQLFVTQSLNFSRAGSCTWGADVATLITDNLNANGTVNFYPVIDGTLQTSSVTGFFGFNAVQRGTVSTTLDITAGTHEIGFVIENGGIAPLGESATLVSYLDNARLTFRAAPVPAPDALLTALLGSLPGVGWLMRRRRA